MKPTVEQAITLLDDANKCPNCSDGQIIGGDMEPNGNSVYRNCQCNNCELEYVEVFTLTGISCPTTGDMIAEKTYKAGNG